ncbi:hypothetical protein [Bradyrhizobium diazoefficiens]|uniref:hypothetical protein n=1 Tax=Bradyrhizobium diazoefficiens TaxID=1355477 RepID=UPI002715368A|nr:hypothetical protein [Bradyrhizobium diazoefficiens]WLB42092.1 hypothetical protein QIH78_20565 [Bradyrhizobium diazoefficiens]
MSFATGTPIADNNPLPIAGNSAVVIGTMQRPADTLAYAIGDIVAQSTAAASCSGVPIAASRDNDTTGVLRRCRVKVNDLAWFNATLYVHVFKDTPTFSSGDNAAFAAALSESNYLGAFSVTLDQKFAGSVTKGIGAPLSGSEIVFDPSAGTTNVFFVIETRTAVTPGSAKTFTAAFEVFRD